MDGQECLPKFFGPLSVVKSGSGRFNKAIITTIAWWNFSIDVRALTKVITNKPLAF